MARGNQLNLSEASVLLYTSPLLPAPFSQFSSSSPKTPTSNLRRPKSGQVYEVLPHLGSRLVMKKVAWCDSFQMNSVKKREVQNTRIKDTQNTARIGKPESQRQRSRGVCMQNTAGRRWVGGVGEVSERACWDTRAWGVWKWPELEGAWAGVRSGRCAWKLSVGKGLGS